MTVMTVNSDRAGSRLLVVGDLWVIDLRVVDGDGCPVDAVPVVTVTLPAGTTATATVTTVTTGVYRATYTPATAGRYVAEAVFPAGYGVNVHAAYVMAVTTAAGMPVAADVVEYMGATSHTLDEVQDALDAEAAAQRSVCRVRAVYPDDLRQALLRRVQRNLALRQLPLAVLQGDAELGATVLPGRDPEVRRFEAPHRKLVVG